MIDETYLILIETRNEWFYRDVCFTYNLIFYNCVYNNIPIIYQYLKPFEIIWIYNYI